MQDEAVWLCEGSQAHAEYCHKSTERPAQGSLQLRNGMLLHVTSALLTLSLRLMGCRQLVIVRSPSAYGEQPVRLNSFLWGSAYRLQRDAITPKALQTMYVRMV